MEGRFDRRHRFLDAVWREEPGYFGATAALLGVTMSLPRHLALLDWAREAGMHLLGWLPVGSDDQAIAQLAAGYQVSTHPLSRFFLEPSAQRALLRGYAGVPIPAIQEGVRRLATAFAHVRVAG
jgi:GntR family transcriptional regulator/MocR family aminotransferase